MSKRSAESLADPSQRPALPAHDGPATDVIPDSARSLLALFEGVMRRQHQLEAAAEITHEMVSGQQGTERVLEVVARRVQELCDADAVYIALDDPDGRPDSDGTHAPAGHRIAAHIGLTDSEVVALRRAELPFVDMVLAGVALPPLFPPGHPLTAHGPAIGALVRSLDGPIGAIMAARLSRRNRFEPEDVQLLEWFGDKVSLALELQARQDAQRQIDIVAERDRIARDLHDHVIQRLYAVGMRFQATADKITEPAVRQEIQTGVDQLDQTVREIRTTIFDLHTTPGPGRPSLRRRLLNIVAEGTGGQPVTPVVEFVGPVDALVPTRLFVHVEAVLREAVSNAVRHSGASELIITIAAGVRLTIIVEDDGRGIGPAACHSGLRNLSVRAQGCGGTFEAGPREGGGTRLVWSVPLNDTSPA